MGNSSEIREELWKANKECMGKGEKVRLYAMSFRNDMFAVESEGVKTLPVGYGENEFTIVRDIFLVSTPR